MGYMGLDVGRFEAFAKRRSAYAIQLNQSADDMFAKQDFIYSSSVQSFDSLVTAH